MNHKLRVLVRVDVDPAHVTLEITGCVTQSDSATLMHIVRRACRLEAGAEVVIDLHGASHLDPEVLLDLRRLVDSKPLPIAEGDAPAVPFRLVLDEPTVLPICLLHVGADGEVLHVAAEGEVLPGLDVAPDSAAAYGPGDADSALAAETGVLDLDSINGLALSEYFEGALDPAATVRALSDTALCQLADALYRHLDTSTPYFGAHTWYELAAEELQNRHLTGGDGPEEDEELSPDTAVA
ncbi:hypothetical protein [Arthrobacter sp. ov118]|jgi:hypothetical protein|uniref:hypothetical protein n=1 Tax=Arthrobacter sp. ov118 TaxID=1761747 RepID=UPI0008E9C4FA|nr:hypothetical protein [Arthrobacter sp. ov118]SFT81379.1 hypothetical protein SAMN04487915_103382 [Arthrobacter sp. ov118]